MKPGQGNRIIRILSTSFRVLRVLLHDLYVPERLKMLEYLYVHSAFSAFDALTSRKTPPQSAGGRLAGRNRVGNSRIRTGCPEPDSLLLFGIS